MSYFLKHLFLQVTERGRYADPEAAFYAERWLLSSSEEHQVIVFASDQDIATIFGSTHLIVDGTFKISPTGFTQLYTIHAWGMFEYEAMPVVHALMRSKNQASYHFLFSQLREKLVQNHGGIGVMTVIHADFELAVHVAVRDVFPEIQLKG